MLIAGKYKESLHVSIHYNVLGIVQIREGIKIHCKTYLMKLAKAHGWNDISRKPTEPIHPDAVKILVTTFGPAIDFAEGVTLAKQNGSNIENSLEKPLSICILLT
jgi:hypothetical protein